jgi:hypothetical protein
MLYVLVILVALLVGLLLLRLRLTLDLTEERKQLFVGLGRTGPEIDFDQKIGRLKFAGMSVKQFSLEQSTKCKKETRKQETPTKEDSESKSKRVSISEILSLLSKSMIPLLRYFVHLFKKTKMEHFDGSFVLGFDDPSQTGRVYGYYQAAAAAAPATIGRIRMQPDFTEERIEGSLSVSFALPVYNLLGATTRLLWQLPIKEIVRMTIHRKTGGKHVRDKSSDRAA